MTTLFQHGEAPIELGPMPAEVAMMAEPGGLPIERAAMPTVPLAALDAVGYTQLLELGLPAYLGGSTVGDTARPRPGRRPDAEIAAEIDGYLRRGLNADHAVGVRVAAGEVTLTGQLDRQLHVHLLTDWVAGVPGVVGVRSQLTARLNDAVVPFVWG